MNNSKRDREFRLNFIQCGTQHACNQLRGESQFRMVQVEVRYVNRCWEDAGIAVRGADRLFIKSRGGRGAGAGRDPERWLYGTICIYTSTSTDYARTYPPAEITLPPGAHRAATKQVFVYMPTNFSPAICFDGPFLENEGFRPKMFYDGTVCCFFVRTVVRASDFPSDGKVVYVLIIFLPLAWALEARVPMWFFWCVL